MGIAAPLTFAAASEQSHTINCAIDSGAIHVEKSAPAIAFRFAGVSMVLGKTALTVMPESFTSAAAFFTKATRAAFDTAYAENPGDASTAALDPTATIRPRFAAIIEGREARMTLKAVLAFTPIIRSQTCSLVAAIVPGLKP